MNSILRLHRMLPHVYFPLEQSLCRGPFATITEQSTYPEMHLLPPLLRNEECEYQTARLECLPLQGKIRERIPFSVDYENDMAKRKE
jgi:hypothetical protein